MFLLTEHFRRELGGSFRLTEPVKDFFRRHAWPGNIRELRNAVEYFIYTGHEDIGLEDLPPTLFLSGSAALVTASQKWMAEQYQADAERWGYMDPGRWNAFYQWLNDNGLVENPIAENAGFTNDFLPQ